MIPVVVPTSNMFSQFALGLNPDPVKQDHCGFHADPYMKHCPVPPPPHCSMANILVATSNVLVFRLGAVSEERDTYERETARLQSQLQLEQAQRAEMAAHVKVKGIGPKGTGSRA